MLEEAVLAAEKVDSALIARVGPVEGEEEAVEAVGSFSSLFQTPFALRIEMQYPLSLPI
jgi:hypothetical protein